MNLQDWCEGCLSYMNGIILNHDILLRSFLKLEYLKTELTH